MSDPATEYPTQQTTSSLGPGIAATIIFIVLWALSSLFGGWVLQLSWAWSIAPVFHVPTLTLVQAITVACFIVLAKIGPRDYLNMNRDPIASLKSYGWYFFATFILLGTLFLLHPYL